MLRFITSLTFLYAFTIAILILYGLVYYRSFAKNRFQKRRFPLVFLVITAACFAFLYININAPLRLKTFSNLDHHFIRHDGFKATGSIELGRTDTVNFRANAFNRFVISRNGNNFTVKSAYSEEPFYSSNSDRFKLLSANFPAVGHDISFQSDSFNVSIRSVSDSIFELHINNSIFRTGKEIRKGISGWNVFREELAFINSPYYTDEKLLNSLKNIFLLRDDVSRTEAGALKYFLSGCLFQQSATVKYDQNNLSQNSIIFSSALEEKSSIAWGVGFLDNNRNQFRIQRAGADSFSLLNKYPVSYPLSEENRPGDFDNWNMHSVTKFLVSDSRDLVSMPDVFNEGFLFSAFNGDSSIDFSPVLLTYQKGHGDAPLELKARFMHNANREIAATNDQLVLPARSSNFSWVFSVQNSFDWKFGSSIFTHSTWQLLLFGSLGFFFVLVFFSSWLRPAYKLSWIWQLLSCITMVLLTTRFLLYWRYKSFPPYEGMDLPSVQQLNSIWNFGIIILAAIILAVIFGFDFLKFIYDFVGKKLALFFHRSYRERNPGKDYLSEENISTTIQRFPLIKKGGPRLVFFLAWVIVLVTGGGFAALNNFDPSTCRHLAIVLMLIYFVFIFISYKHSPLAASAEKSWWSLSTGRSLDILVNNPVKVLLSVSMLALFVFVDIGFAIVFLNFLLFNEAFLCINYAIAGLSAGSRRNARLFGGFGAVYLLLFVINLTYGPYIFKYLLELPQLLYTTGYFLFAVSIAYTAARLLHRMQRNKRVLAGLGLAVFLFITAFLFFPKDRILKKAAMTKYRIDVMAMPVDKAIEEAYQDGKTYTPVIRAAQNQWFINTFIYEENNPGVNEAGFHLLPHAPQNKGAKYNAQATDLVASRFLIAEHGKWSVLLYVLLLMLPTTLLASFYKLYPDFTNRINNNYPTITAGFSLLNYLLITALLVILAATGRYIFFGQDLPFGSILSKQSILFPCFLIITVVLLFRRIPLKQYPNRKKLIPGAIVFVGLGLLLFLFKPSFNRNKEFAVTDIAKDMDMYIQLRLQPVLDYFDTSRATRKLSLLKKDKLFTDSVRQMITAGHMDDAGKFFQREIGLYSMGSFSRHLDQNRMLYLDMNSGRPQLAVNDNYFHIDPPPHLQQYWTGNVFGDTTNYNITLWDAADGSVASRRISEYTNEPAIMLSRDLRFAFRQSQGENLYDEPCLVNNSAASIFINTTNGVKTLKANDTLNLRNPDRVVITDSATGKDRILTIQPDAFMKNYYVNGSRFYVYPMAEQFIWARNFAESVSSEYTAKGMNTKDAFISLDAGLMDSLSARIQNMMAVDTSYHKGAEYGICIADGNGRLVAMTDFINGMNRPDPNDKAGFNSVIQGENGLVSQSLLRKQIGNINLLRLNPGPGSTLKPIVFSAIASQLNLDWDAFAAEGFSVRQKYFGGEKVAEYDFEKNNGRITTVKDYLRLSDNYYHSNLLLLGSYSRQSLQDVLMKHFANKNPEAMMHWPYFSYKGKEYWLDGFENWPGYLNGQANFGSDSSFVSVGLFNNYGIFTDRVSRSFDKFSSVYDSSLFLNASTKSGFLMPEYALFDQKATGMNRARPNEVFMSSFRGHVKGSSQVMIPPVKMAEAFGKLVSQNRNYGLTLNPYATENIFKPFYTDNGVTYSQYISLMKESVFPGMREALFRGTAAGLGALLKDGSPYYYYAKTGTTGDDELKEKSKLFVIVISSKDLTNPDYNFRNNKFFTIYFTSQSGPAKQNEKFQAEIIKYVQQSAVFNRYMAGAGQKEGEGVYLTKTYSPK
jgi:hypothetical protein